MPKIQRETQKIFCNSADSDQIVVFGSMATGTPVYSNNIEDLQNNEAFNLGWDAATLEDKAPFMEEMNGMQYGITKQLAYNFQEGIPEYDAGTTYYIGSICKVLEEGKPVLYTSLTDENLGNNPVTDATNWERLSFGGGGLEIGDIGFTQMAIDESKGKRRVLNGQLIIQEQYVQFTNIIKQSVALNPSLACTEAEWQTEVTMNTFGLCGKFVIDDNAGTIRLPKYPNYFIAGLANIAPVAGNGMTLGLTNGTGNTGLLSTPSAGAYILESRNDTYGKKVNTSSSNAAGLSNSVGITTDPTKSGIEAQINEKQIAGQYFIQVATGAETEDNIINEIELNNPFSLLDYKYSEYELNNLSWLRSNGQYNSKAVYPAVYDLLLKIYNGTEAKAGVSVKLSTETFTDYDFVLNTAEETFRLPVKLETNIKNGFDYTKGYAVSSSFTATEDGLVTYKLGTTKSGNAKVNGVTILEKSIVTSDDNASLTQTFQCSKGDVIVLPQGGTFYPQKEVANTEYLYFYVGETVQNANLINAGRIEEKLADKLDLSAVKAYITETYINGTSGYNVYSNRWSEQWGETPRTSPDAQQTITFLKQFANTDYYFNRSCLMNNITGTTSGYFTGYFNKTTNSVTIQSSSYTDKTSWYACGYIA